MIIVYQSKADPDLTMIVEGDDTVFPQNLNRHDWILIQTNAEITEDITADLQTQRFVMVRNNLPIGTRTKIGLMPK